MPESKKILLLGAGGHCKSVLDSLLQSEEYESIGLIDKITKASYIVREFKASRGVRYLGDDNDLPRLFTEGYTDAFVALGSIGDSSLRNKLYAIIRNIGFQVPNIVDSSAAVSPYATLGEGVYIGKNAVVNSDSIIGNCAIINTSAVVEHECSVGDFVHVAPGSIVCGNVTIGWGTHIGAGSVIRQGVRIGSETMIGMGSIVLKDIGDYRTAYGNPCKEVQNG
jgi:sugar O-acyltransferase (sialic acid O-acetyltransferase NeuD family)